MSIVSLNKLLFTFMFLDNEWKYWNTSQKFKVELCTFPDSTNTETTRTVVLAWRDARACVCVRKSLSVDNLRTS